jgi:hypothetical protein
MDTFLCFSHYLGKCFKFVYRKVMVMATLTAGLMFLIFNSMQFLTWGTLQGWSAFTPTAIEVIRNCRKFEKQCFGVTPH